MAIRVNNFFIAKKMPKGDIFFAHIKSFFYLCKAVRIAAAVSV